MPLQSRAARPPSRISRHPDPLPIKWHVWLPIVEIVLEPAAHEETAIGGDGHVSLVKEAVDVGPQEEAVVELVLASHPHGEDVGGVQDRERLLSRDGASALVVVRDQDPERPLAQPWADEDRVPIHHLRLRGHLIPDPGELEPLAHLGPEALRRRRVRLEGLSLDDVEAELLRDRDPLALVEEERLAEEDAADLGVEVHRRSPVLLEAAPHLLQGPYPVHRAEGLPGQGVGEEGGVDEEAAAGDEVFGGVELEEEQLARLQSPEDRLASRLPEVDLLDAGLAPQEAEPVVVRDSDEELHGEPMMTRGEGSGQVEVFS